MTFSEVIVKLKTKRLENKLKFDLCLKFLGLLRLVLGFC